MNRDSQIIPHPPQLPSYGITRSVRMRFLSTTSLAGHITYQNLLDTVIVASGATTGSDLFEAVRVEAVEVWAQAAIGTPVTTTVIFDGATIGAYGDQKTHTDTSMGVEPAHVKARPDPLTQAGQFQVSAADNAFYIAAPTGSVIDVSLTFRQPVTGVNVPAQNALVAAVAGTLYFRGLDGKSIATTNLPVQGAVSVI
jgi:hypothetical protein